MMVHPLLYINCLISGNEKITMDEYSQYTAEDFASDEDFIAWVRQPTEELNSFWNAWISQNGHRKAEFERGRQIVMALKVKKNLPREGAMLKVWANINSATGLYEPVEREGGSDKRIGWRTQMRRYYAVAATFLVLIVAGTLLFIKRSETITIATQYGESRTLILPDSTRVTLNGNSGLRYNRFGLSGGTREVWLDGEAFFAVSRTLAHDKFVVHTNELQVVVLGTRFNVLSRRGNTKVVLDEGSVKLDMKGATETLIMQPGQLVEFSKKSGSVVKKEVDPEDYSSWRNNQLIFKRASLQEIAVILEDTYGMVVTFKDDRLKEKFFTGSSSSDDIQELLDKLSELFSLKITRKGNHIIIQERKGINQ